MTAIAPRPNLASLVGARVRGEPDCGEGSVHSRGNPMDGAAVGHLESVHGFGPILELANAQQPVAIPREGRQGDVGHSAMRGCQEQP